MKTMLKTFVMFGLSACVLLGGALSSFAAEGGHYSAQLLGHQADSCSGTAGAEIVVRFASPYGAVDDYTICAECGKVAGGDSLSKVSDTVANFGGLKVYQGKLDNGERVMTVACISGPGAMQDVTANVMLPWSAVEGYELYLVNADGGETKLEPYGGDWAYLDVNMQEGAALIRMLPQ